MGGAAGPFRFAGAARQGEVRIVDRCYVSEDCCYYAEHNLWDVHIWRASWPNVIMHVEQNFTEFMMHEGQNFSEYISCMRSRP